MRIPARRRLTVLAVLAGLAAAALSQGPPLPRRVVLVSFDGAGGLDLARRLADGQLGPDGFERAGRTGLAAERLRIVAPSLTAVSHASISTGAPPSMTGIVANTFHPARTSIRTRVSAFDVESDVETLWEAASRQGKRVASLTWPGLAQRVPRTTTPVGIRFVDMKANGVVFHVSPGPLPDAMVALPLGIRSFSPPKELRVDAPGGSDGARRESVPFVVIDTTDDGRRTYDELLALSPDGSLRARARSGEWFSLVRRADLDEGDRDVRLGRWGKVLKLAPDLSALSVYVSCEGRTFASPDDFRRTLDRRAGFWPGPPDTVLLEQQPPEVASFAEQAARFSQFFVDAYEVAERRGDWDLLLAYQPVIDEVEHALLLTDPRQPAYTRENAALAEKGLREVWRAADRAAARYLRDAGPGRDVFLVSDHGMRAIWRTFYIVEALRRGGFVRTEPDGKGRLRVARDTPVDVATHGGIGLVVVNRMGRLEGGTVPGPRAEVLVTEIATYLRSLKDQAGEPVFSVVATAAEAKALDLDHPNAGDLIAIVAGGTTIRGGLKPEGSLFGEPDLPGQHGFDWDPELDGIFFHVGEGVGAERVPEIRATDVARRVAERLGIAPPGGPR